MIMRIAKMYVRNPSTATSSQFRVFPTNAGMKGARYFSVLGVKRYHQSVNGGFIFACIGPCNTPRPSDSQTCQKTKSFCTKVSQGIFVGSPKVELKTPTATSESSTSPRGVVMKKTAVQITRNTATMPQCHSMKLHGKPRPPSLSTHLATPMSVCFRRSPSLSSSGGGSCPAILVVSHVTSKLVPTSLHTNGIVVTRRRSLSFLPPAYSPFPLALFP
mmetsp:Transcript_57729/g.137394  ORF Transcript_57729/g.137394 Transcript_57729/m.137394 type:complete len:217 (-) Transcript_57729:21-671(-)